MTLWIRAEDAFFPSPSLFIPFATIFFFFFYNSTKYRKKKYSFCLNLIYFWITLQFWNECFYPQFCSSTEFILNFPPKNSNILTSRERSIFMKKKKKETRRRSKNFVIPNFANVRYYVVLQEKLISKLKLPTMKI